MPKGSRHCWVWILVAAQLLLAVPAMALSASASAPMTDCEDPCPCCPDGSSLADCLATCTLAAAAVPITPMSRRSNTTALRVDEMTAVAFSSVSEAPLKPPPIR